MLIAVELQQKNMCFVCLFLGNEELIWSGTDWLIVQIPPDLNMYCGNTWTTYIKNEIRGVF